MTGLVSERERAQAVADVRAVIVSAGQEATVLRAVPGERLYGTDETEYAAIGTVPVDGTLTPAEDLGQRIDGMASILPDADVRIQDRLQIDGATYRVQAVRPERWFGVVTHQVVTMVRLHGC